MQSVYDYISQDLSATWFRLYNSIKLSYGDEMTIPVSTMPDHGTPTPVINVHSFPDWPWQIDTMKQEITLTIL